MKLIVESDMRKMELIKEAYDPSKPQTIKLRGVFMQAETQNANSRKYHLEELEKEVAKFKEEKIDKGTALSELEHPDEVSINPDRVCARILCEEKVMKGKAQTGSLFASAPKRAPPTSGGALFGADDGNRTRVVSLGS